MNLGVHYCVRHPDRLAAARCPSCGREFCRECVTEHSGRFTCSDCLREQARQADEGRTGFLRATLQWVVLVVTLLAAWTVFYQGGLQLLDLPDIVHTAESLGVPE